MNKKNIIAMSIMSAIACNAYALPTSATFKSGTGSLSNYGSSAYLNVDTFNSKGNAVVNVDNFNIGISETMNVNGGGKSNTVLINDKQGAITNIDGTLNSSVRTILVNPQGINVSGTAVINAQYGMMAVAGTINESALDADSEADVVVTFNTTSQAQVTVDNNATIRIDAEAKHEGYTRVSPGGTGYDVYEVVSSQNPQNIDWNSLPGITLDTSGSTVWGAYTTHGDIHYDSDVIYRNMKVGSQVNSLSSAIGRVVADGQNVELMRDDTGRLLTRDEALLALDVQGYDKGYGFKQSAYFDTWSATSPEYADYQQKLADYQSGGATTESEMIDARNLSDSAYQASALIELQKTASVDASSTFGSYTSFETPSLTSFNTIASTSDVLFNRVNIDNTTITANGETVRFSNVNLNNAHVNSASHVVLSGDVLGGSTSSITTTGNVMYDNKAAVSFIPVINNFDVDITASSIGNINRVGTINYDTTRNITGTARNTSNTTTYDIEGNNLYGNNDFVYHGQNLTLTNVSNSRIFAEMGGNVTLGNATNTHVKNYDGTINLTGDIGSSNQAVSGTNVFRANTVNFTSAQPLTMYDSLFILNDGGSVSADTSLVMNNTRFGSRSHHEHTLNTVYNTQDYMGWGGSFLDVTMNDSLMSESYGLSFNNLTMVNSNINGTAPSSGVYYSTWNNPGVTKGGMCITFYCQRDYQGNVDPSIDNAEAVKDGFTMVVNGDLTMSATGSGNFSLIYGNDHSFNSVALLGDVTGSKYVNRALTNKDQPSMGLNSIKADSIYVNDATKATFEGTTSNVATWSGDVGQTFLTVYGNTSLNNGVIGVNRFANGTTEPVVVPPTPVDPVTPPTPPVDPVTPPVVPPVVDPVVPPTPPVVPPVVDPVTPPPVVVTPIVLPTFNVEVRDDVKETKVERNTLVLASPSMIHEDNVEVTTTEKEED